MKSHRSGRTVAFVALLVVVASPVVAFDTAFLERAREHWTEGRNVSILISQQEVLYTPASGETVELQWAPFTIWVLFTATPDCFLHVSPEPTVYDAIDYEWALRDALGDDIWLVQGMAENSLNVDRTVYLSPFAAHYLMNPSEGEIRFNRVLFGTFDTFYVVGGRDVERVRDDTDWDDPKEYDVTRMPFDELFLTAHYSLQDSDTDYLPYVIDFFRVRLEFVD